VVVKKKGISRQDCEPTLLLDLSDDSVMESADTLSKTAETFVDLPPSLKDLGATGKGKKVSFLFGRTPLIFCRLPWTSKTSERSMKGRRQAAGMLLVPSSGTRLNSQRGATSRNQEDAGRLAQAQEACG
jgi:hypothetical protein